MTPRSPTKVGMDGLLASAFRKTFPPVGKPSVEAEIADLCARISRVGEDRGGLPFRLDDRQHGESHRG